MFFLSSISLTLKKYRSFFCFYGLLLLILYLNFIIFYAKIDYPMHAPFVVIGPTLFTLINSVLFSLPFFIFSYKKTYLFIYLLFVNILLSINVVYFHYYGNVIPFFSYGNISNIYEMSSTLRNYFRLSDFVFFIPTIALFILYSLIRDKQYVHKTLRLKIAVILFSFCASIIFCNYIQDKINNTTAAQKFYNRDTNQPEFVSYYGLLPLWTYQLYTYLYSDRKPLIGKELETINSFINNKKTFTSNNNTSNNSDKNLIIIIVESLDSWTLKYLNGQVTPFLTQLSTSDSVIFLPNVLPQVHQGRSSDAQLIINTGLLPVLNNAVANIYAEQNYPSIPAALGKKYFSFSVMGNKSTFWNQKTMNITYKMDSLISIENLDNRDIIGYGISDSSLFAQTAKILKKTRQPFYCQIITLSSHDGVDFKNYKTTLQFPKQLSEKTRNYIKSIHYVDKSIESFIRLLKKEGLYSHSIIIITADHNTAEAENILDIAPNLFSKYEKERQTAFIPFFILNSECRFSQKTEQAIGQIDIYPTILDIMSLPKYYWRGIGQSIFSEQPPAFAIDVHQNYAGDTTINKENVKNLKSSWSISDLMIRKKYFNHTKQ